MSGGDAPLYATTAAPVPPGGGAEWFAGAAGARLRAALFNADEARRGSVVISPGRTEPIEKYFEIVRRLTGRGWRVLVHDWRGQGLSQRLSPTDRGDARGADDFLADFARLLDAFETRLPQPVIALGHSMGGCLTLLALARGERRFAAAMLSAPMLGVETDPVPAPLARLAARGLTLIGQGSRIARAEPAVTPFAQNVLTHDAERYRRNVEQIEAWPELRVGPPTWGWLDFAFTAMDELAAGSGLASVTIPVAVATAGEDRVVDSAASVRIAKRLPVVRLASIRGAYHELMQETDALQTPFWDAFDALTENIR